MKLMMGGEPVKRYFEFVVIEYIPELHAGSSRINIAIAVLDRLAWDQAEVRVRDHHVSLIRELGCEKYGDVVEGMISMLASKLPSCDQPYRPIETLRRMGIECGGLWRVSELRFGLAESATLLADKLAKIYFGARRESLAQNGITNLDRRPTAGPSATVPKFRH